MAQNMLTGQKRIWAQTNTFLPRYDCDHTIITCQGTNMSGHKRVWAQTYLGTNVGTNVCGHKRVWAQTFLGTILRAQVCMGTNVWSPMKNAVQ